MTQVTRFAPSPTGRLHLGHAYAALFARQEARASKGRFLLRIEDIDTLRCKPEFEAGITEDLEWLGFTWETPVRRQSEHLAEYQEALDRLGRDGFLYPCFCTRAEIRAEIARAGAAHGPDGPLYPGLCRALDPGERAARQAAGEPYALRLDVAKATAAAGEIFFRDYRQGRIRATPEVLGDVVLARKDVPTSYHLAATLDDHAQGVTLVTRGADLFAATHVHRLLQALLGLKTPEYHHHKLIFGNDGQKLSKTAQAPSLKSLREAGHSAEEVRLMAIAAATR
ncbi:MAG TPA: tRNA glutamyl-Q(34) synthetase GluQRS [Alphaproteobacteria bacterium]|nr:tRNA glutamyl-Q(34) synthetase GluQRS [Alphaproteobacteria bacterium]